MVVGSLGLLLLVVLICTIVASENKGQQFLDPLWKDLCKWILLFLLRLCGGYFEGQAGISFLTLVNGVLVLPNIYCPVFAPLEWSPCRWVNHVSLFLRQGFSAWSVILMAMSVLHLYCGHTWPCHIFFLCWRLWRNPQSDLNLFCPLIL